MFDIPLNIGNDWDTVLKDVINKPQIIRLLFTIKEAYSKEPKIEIYPPADHVFDALKYTSFADTRVIILGQDPYIKPGQAHGLAFSVLPGVPIPPSEVNILKEISQEFGYPMPNNGCLIPWAQQGVLLLNSILTVQKKDSNSHAGVGWEEFTDAIIMKINELKNGCVFMLWGLEAKKKARLIDKEKHLILTAAHPSPLAGGAFFGCNHFIKCNDWLYETSKSTINWQLPDV